MTSNSKRRLRVAFVHPDLGLGGAERLIVDAAVALATCNHTVDIYTAHYDPNRCFEETKTELFSITVAGSWFPRQILGRFHVVCAIIRCCLACLAMAWRTWSGTTPDYDVVVVDQVAAVIPLLKLLLAGTRVLFYCHFPDQLLTGRRSLLKAMYRAPIDWIEEEATGKADTVLVNSNYTRGVFQGTFKRLWARGMRPEVLYPCVAVPTDAELAANAAGWPQELDSDLVTFIKQGPTFLSVNRFERKKGLELAVKALAELRSRSPGASPQLILAGGCDERLAENREYHAEMQQLVVDLQLQDAVKFMLSFMDRQRSLLLAACRAVLYTPQHEHFGIVPIEAMVAGRPVVVCNSGGPTESVTSSSGFQCEPTPAAFATAMQQLLDNSRCGQLQRGARNNAVSRFAREAFAQQLNRQVLALAHS